MLPIPNLIVLTFLILLGAGLLAAVTMAAARGGGFIGKPSSHPWLFYTGKLAIFGSIGLMILKAVDPAIPPVELPGWLPWTGSLLVSLGSLIMLIAFFTLGVALKYGLPEENTKLVTTGIFRFSRHPLYAGLFLLNIGSVLFFPSGWNLLVSAWCIVAHVLMIRGEERFLAGRFGQEWDLYKKRVRLLF